MEKVSRARKVLKIAACSRLALFTLQVIFNAFISDHEAEVFKKPKPRPRNHFEYLLTFLFEGLERWDGQHFLHIAEYGYEYEKSLAFFPLFPLAVRSVANTVLAPLQLFVNYHIVLLLAAVLFNFLVFVAAVVIFFEFSLDALSDEQWAYKAALLFCFNPASIFFSAAYSETLFCFLVLTALHQCQKGHYNISALLFSFATWSRSNGMVNAGFLIYANIILPVCVRRSSLRCSDMVLSVICGAIRAALIVFPFIAFQFYTYKHFCEWPASILAKSSQRFMKNTDEYVVVGQYTPWCDQRYPISYAYVQEHYWGVGFLKYYQVKQIPNFILAAPAIFLCIQGVFNYAIRILNSLNTWRFFPQDLTLIPFIIHCSFLLVFGLTSMHVQVVTRLLISSSPLPCWFAAELLPDVAQVIRPMPKMKKKKRPKSKFPLAVQCLKSWKHLKTAGQLVMVYFLSYFVIGSAAFSNFLPWT